MVLIYSNIYFAFRVKEDKPYEKIDVNKIEFVNEAYIVCITNLLFAMAPCSDTKGGEITAAEIRFKIGLMINYIIIALFLSNVLFVAKISFYDAKLSFRKKYNIYMEKKRLK